MDDFDITQAFPDSRNPYPKTRITEIQRNKKQLGGELFIEQLLHDVAHFSRTSQLYPPRSSSNLQHVCSQIMSANMIDTLKKHCFIYYLLLDYEYNFPPGPGTVRPTEAYARRVLLPETFIDLMTALWLLDNLRVEEAIPRICNPGVTAPWPEKIVGILARHGSPEIAVGFVAATQPVLKGDDAVTTYFQALLVVDIGDAFMYQRATSPGLQEKLWKMMVEYCIETGGEAAMTVVNLPLTDDERDRFGKTLKEINNDKSRDALIIWWMHIGKYEDALRIMESAEAQTDQMGGLDWGILGEGLRKGLGLRYTGGGNEMQT